MPPRTRSYHKAKRAHILDRVQGREESVCENNLELCITNFFKEHADYKHFRGRQCQHYDILRQEFENHVASGNYAYNSTQPPIDTDEERELENQRASRGKAKAPVSVLDSDSDDAVPVLAPKVKNKGKGKRKTPEHSGAEKGGGCCAGSGPSPEYLGYLKKLASRISDQLKSSGMSVSQPPPPNHQKPNNPYSVDACMDMLNELDLPRGTVARVALPMFRDAVACIVFAKMSVEERLEFVKNFDKQHGGSA